MVAAVAIRCKSPKWQVSVEVTTTQISGKLCGDVSDPSVHQAQLSLSGANGLPKSTQQRVSGTERQPAG
jgi:hypothetical protein